MPKQLRVYPTVCQSAYCGRGKCDGCPNLPELESFKRWRTETAAVKADPIWCPTVWTATRAEGAV